MGLGHLVRSLAVAGALARSFRVVFCCGGPVPPDVRIPAGIELIRLPPIGAARNGGLVSLEPAVSLGQAWERRRELLLWAYRAARPAAIVVELFPFGRTSFARELLPLLAAARADRVRVISSVRDLLVTAKRDQQAHDDLTAARLEHYFDAVIVHADERFARLEETFRPSAPVSVPVLYSGFVCPDRRRIRRAARVPPEVLVSAGGGSQGGALLLAAARAHRRHLAARGWRTTLLTGPFLPADDRAQLSATSAGCSGLTVERFIPDLVMAMAGAAASVSQCGYNTSLDLLRAGVPAVVVPYAEGRETEQSERARRLAALGAVVVLRSHRLTPRRLAESVLRAIAAPPPRIALDLAGAENTATLVSELVRVAPASGRTEAA